jgi:peptidoglycan/LPS O-acetylase OafA/YrhL
MKKVDDRSDAPWLWRGQLPSFDGLRGLGILCVLLAHAQGSRGFPQVAGLSHVALWCSGLGPNLFFVVSGFLITLLLLRELDRAKRLDLKSFYLRRVLRIVPAYLCLLGVVAILQVAGQSRVPAREWVAASTFTVNFLEGRAKEIGHTWSLSIQEHFYLVWPIVLTVLGAAGGRRVALACLVACPLARWVILLRFHALCRGAEEWTFTRLDTIAAGCLLALLVWEPAWRRRLDWIVTRNRLVLLTFLCLVVSQALWIASGKYCLGIGYTVNALCLALLTWAAIRRCESPMGKFLDSWALRTLGIGSFSLYLWQQLFLERKGEDFTCGFPQNVLFALLAALVSYQLIEKPFLKLRDRCRPVAAKAPSAAAVAPVPEPTLEPTPERPPVLRPVACAAGVAGVAG